MRFPPLMTIELGAAAVPRVATIPWTSAVKLDPARVRRAPLSTDAPLPCELSTSLLVKAILLLMSETNAPYAFTPAVVIEPPFNRIEPPLSASAPAAPRPDVAMVRFVPNILLLASNTCRPSALAPLVLMLEFSSLIVPPNAAAPSAWNPAGDRKPEVVIVIPFAVTVPPLKAKMPKPPLPEVV